MPIDCFVKEIDKLSAERFGRSFPKDNIRHACAVENAIKNNETPECVRYAFFKLTMRCNSDCEYCEHAFSKNQGKYTEQPLDVLLDVVEQLKNAGVTACSVSGGEPLTYPQIDVVIKKMVESGIEPILLTNGILLPQKINSLYEAGLRYVIMSVDSFESQHYENTRGVSFDQILRAYNYMLEFVRKNPSLLFRLTTVFSSENTKDVIPLIQKATQDGVGVQLTPYHNFVNSNDRLTPQNIKEVSGVIQQLIKMKDQGANICNSKPYLQYFSDFFSKNSRIPREIYRCRCGYEAVYIWPDLSVKSCWTTTLPILGNLNDNSLLQIWNSPEYRKQRKMMLNCECEGCWLLCTAEFNIALDDYSSRQGDPL